MSAWCVLLAAGKGSRSGLDVNKVFFRWQGRSVLSRCIDALAAADAYDGVVLVLSEAELAAKYREALGQLAKYRADKSVPALARGTTLHQIVFQFKGTELVRLEQIAEEKL